MHLTFRVQKNTDGEIQLGHKLSFTVADGVDAISITANANGFTPFRAAFRELYLDYKEFENEIIECKKENKVIQLNVSSAYPTLIIVPPTRGQTSKYHTYEYYMIRILEICNFNKAKNLHFTHYGFLNGGFYINEVLSVMKTLLHPLAFTTLENVYFEIDDRHYQEFVSIFNHVRYVYNSNKRFHRIDAPEFEYVTKIKYDDGSSWQQLVLKKSNYD